MSDAKPTNLFRNQNMKAKQHGRLHPYWSRLNSLEDTCVPAVDQPDANENSVTISTQGRPSLQGSQSSRSISNDDRQTELTQSAAKSMEIQYLVHEFTTLLNDSIRIADSVYSVCLLETQIGLLIQAQKLATVQKLFVTLIV
jgi:hypothetical protein